MKTAKITVKDATANMLDPLCDALPSRDFQELARFLQKAERQECDFLVALIENQPIGYCLIYWQSEFPAFKSENTPEIVDLIISEDYRRKGVATKILNEVEQRLIVKNCRNVGLTVLASNTPAHTLYSQRGYRVINKNENTNLMLVKNLLT